MDVDFGEATPLLSHQIRDEDKHTPSWWRRASSSSGVVAILAVSCAAAALVMSLVMLMSQGFGNVDRSFFLGERIQPRTGDVVTTSSLSSGYDTRMRLYVHQDIWAQIFKPAVRCAGIASDSVETQALADYEMYKALQKHPQRVINPADANLFYIPMTLAPSVLLDSMKADDHGEDCREVIQESHRVRIERVGQALEASPWWG